MRQHEIAQSEQALSTYHRVRDSTARDSTVREAHSERSTQREKHTTRTILLTQSDSTVGEAHYTYIESEKHTTRTILLTAFSDQGLHPHALLRASSHTAANLLYDQRHSCQLLPALQRPAHRNFSTQELQHTGTSAHRTHEKLLERPTQRKNRGKCIEKEQREHRKWMREKELRPKPSRMTGR